LNVTTAIELQGAIRTAGGGCLIHVQHCPSVTHGEHTMIYDGWGATNLNTGTNDKQSGGAFSLESITVCIIDTVHCVQMIDDYCGISKLRIYVVTVFFYLIKNSDVYRHTPECSKLWRRCPKFKLLITSFEVVKFNCTRDFATRLCFLHFTHLIHLRLKFKNNYVTVFKINIMPTAGRL